MIELVLPRPPGRDEAVQVQIAAGPLPPAARLILLTEQGEILGALAPFGPTDRGRGSTVTVPVPLSALVDGRLRLLLQVEQPNAPPRSPRPDEVQRLNLILVPRSE
jgi:hypothetical protein